MFMAQFTETAYAKNMAGVGISAEDAERIQGEFFTLRGMVESAGDGNHLDLRDLQDIVAAAQRLGDELEDALDWWTK